MEEITSYDADGGDCCIRMLQPNRMTIFVEPVRCLRVDGNDGLTGYNQEEKESSVRMYLNG